MVSVCLPSDALLQHIPSYLCFSYLGCGVSLHTCSSKAQPLLLTLGEGYLLTITLTDLQSGIAPLGPPMPTKPRLLGLLLPAAAPGLGRRVVPQGHRPWPWTWVAPLGCSCAVAAWHSRPLPLTSDVGYLLSAALSVPGRSRPCFALGGQNIGV